VKLLHLDISKEFKMSTGDASSDKEGSFKAKKPKGPTGQSKSFLLQVTGSIQSAEIFGANDIYCKYNLAMGSDWTVTAV
jgi:hypothetical protein